MLRRKKQKNIMELEFKLWNGVNMEDIDSIEYKHGTPYMVNYDQVMVGEKRILQYVGRMDINGNKIFNGCILQYKHGEQSKSEFYVCRDVVSFNGGGFKIGAISIADIQSTDEKITQNLTVYSNPNQGYSIYERDFDFEVIGNIYENPELLTIPH